MAVPAEAQSPDKKLLELDRLSAVGEGLAEGVNVGRGANVGAGVMVDVGAGIGVSNCPGPQLETTKLSTNKRTAKKPIIRICRFAVIDFLRYYGHTRQPLKRVA